MQKSDQVQILSTVLLPHVVPAFSLKDTRDALWHFGLLTVKSLL